MKKLLAKKSWISLNTVEAFSCVCNCNCGACSCWCPEPLPNEPDMLVPSDLVPGYGSLESHVDDWASMQSATNA